MLVSVQEAEYVSDYKINLHFDDGLQGIVDLKDTIFGDHRKVFEPLRDVSFFKEFTLDSWTITWRNDIDLAPEFLYDLVKKEREKVHSKI